MSGPWAQLDPPFHVRRHEHSDPSRPPLARVVDAGLQPVSSVMDARDAARLLQAVKLIDGEALHRMPSEDQVLDELERCFTEEVSPAAREIAVRAIREFFERHREPVTPVP